MGRGAELGDAANYLKAFDLFVLPSRYEGLPITLTECLFAGIPVIASDVGGNREVTGPRSMYPPDDKAEFLERFSEAAENPSDFLAETEKRTQFSPKAMAGSYEAIFS